MSGATRQAAGDRITKGCLAVLVGLVLLAVLAPAIASDRPYAMFVPEGAERPGAFGALPVGWTSPWLLSLLDARFYESFVDRLFNALLLLSPLLLVALTVRRIASAHWRARRGWYLAVYAVAALAVVLVGSEERPALAYARKLDRMAEQGHSVTAVFPPVPYSARGTDADDQLAAPSTDHWLGTDRSGRDVLVRLLFGVRISLTIGLVSVSIYVVIGLLLGALAGYFRGWVDVVVSRLIEVVSCFPTLLLVLTLMAVTAERSIFHVMLVIGVTGWPSVARLVRAEFLRQGDLDYAHAARALGLSRSRVVLRHLLPNALAPVMVLAAFGVAGAILIESSLAFLSLGDSSVASWGEVLRVGRETGEMHLILAPGLLIFVTVTAMNVVAETLRERFDPRSEQA